MSHSGEEGFRAEPYFLQHPDIDISSLAGQLAISPYHLSRSLQLRHTTESLRQRVTHLVLDLRMNIVRRHLADIQAQMRAAGSDMDRIKQLMQEYKDAQLLRDALARRIGSDIIA